MDAMRGFFSRQGIRFSSEEKPGADTQVLFCSHHALAKLDKNVLSDCGFNIEDVMLLIDEADQLLQQPGYEVVTEARLETLYIHNNWLNIRRNAGRLPSRDRDPDSSRRKLENDFERTFARAYEDAFVYPTLEP